MDFKSTDLPPPYAPQPQDNPGYYESQNIQPPPQQPGHLGQVSPPTTVVNAQPQPQGQIITAVQMDDNLGLAIFATICCFWPVGLAAILKSSEVKTALASGDIRGAQQLAEESKFLSRIAIALGGAIILISVIIVVVVATTTY